MSLAHKRIEDVKEVNLRELVEGGVSEGKIIEYKLTLPGTSDSDKREFLADISSFANASGGDLVYGMKEEKGLAMELVGLSTANLDAEKLRLEEIIRNGIDLRIPGLTIMPVPIGTGNAALVIRVPRSFARPHMVTFKGSSRFYSRTSAGKYQLDVTELRTAFLHSETFAEGARKFRTERLGGIIAAETPVKLKAPPFAVLHLIPASAFDPSSRPYISELAGKADRLRPVMVGGGFHGPRYNFDGLLTHDASQGVANSYAQLFRSGTIEVVLADLNDADPSNQKLLPMAWLEQQFIDALPIYLRAQQDLSVELPVFLAFSLIGVSGYVLSVAERLRRQSYSQTSIDRDALLVPEIALEDLGQNPELVLKPAFDAIWNAAGWPRAMHYDNDGVYRIR
jgi:hypothetical protein